MDIYAKNEQLNFDYDINTIRSPLYPSTFPMHWHLHAECLAMINKESVATISVNQRKISLRYGDIFFIWPGELHEILDNSDKSIVALQFPMSLINSKKEFAVYYEKYKAHSHLRYSDNPKLNSELLADFDDILEIFDNYSDSFRSIKMTTVLYNMFIKIASVITLDAEKKTSASAYGDNIADKLDIACTYIKAHCDEPLTLEDVASYVGFSPCYFSRHFKKTTTHSFVEYLILQRINKLQVLLIDKSLTITEAAFKSGFKSISTLNRTFSKYCGCSPSEYRRYYTS